MRAKKQQEKSIVVDSDLSLTEVEEIVEEVKVEDEQHYTPLSDEETALLDQAHELQSLEQSFKLVMSDDSETDTAIIS